MVEGLESGSLYGLDQDGMVDFSVKVIPVDNDITKVKLGTGYEEFELSNVESEDNNIYFTGEGIIKLNSSRYPIFGSDFTYSDMGGANIDKSSFSLLREETLNGIQCWVVESIPNNPHGSDYSKKISWISKEMIIPVYIEMFDREGKIIKKLTTENIEKIQGYWTPLVTRMENIQINHTTILTMDKIVYNENLPDSIFTSRFLQTGRP